MPRSRRGARLGPMSWAKLGSVIGASFGLIFVLVNTGSLPAAVAVLFRVLAVIAFIAVLIAVVVAGRRPTPAGVDRPAAGGFTLGYWLVVVAEVGAIAAGLVVLNGPLHAPQAAVAWSPWSWVSTSSRWRWSGSCCSSTGWVPRSCSAASPVSSWPRLARLSARSTSWAVSCPEPSSSASGCGAPREALTPRWPGQCRKPNLRRRSWPSSEMTAELAMEIPITPVRESAR